MAAYLHRDVLRTKVGVSLRGAVLNGNALHREGAEPQRFAKFLNAEKFFAALSALGSLCEVHFS